MLRPTSKNHVASPSTHPPTHSWPTHLSSHPKVSYYQSLISPLSPLLLALPPRAHPQLSHTPSFSDVEMCCIQNWHKIRNLPQFQIWNSCPPDIDIRIFDRFPDVDPSRTLHALMDPCGKRCGIGPNGSARPMMPWDHEAIPTGQSGFPSSWPVWCWRPFEMTRLILLYFNLPDLILSYLSSSYIDGREGLMYR